LGEASRIGFGSALGTILLVLSLVPIIAFLVQNFRRESVR
jgi:ABC-type spermidine/putrescine transport system permease subunit I